MSIDNCEILKRKQMKLPLLKHKVGLETQENKLQEKKMALINTYLSIIIININNPSSPIKRQEQTKLKTSRCQEMIKLG